MGLEIVGIILSIISAFIIGWSLMHNLIELLLKRDITGNDGYNLISVLGGLGTAALLLILGTNLPKEYSFVMPVMLIPAAIYFIIKVNKDPKKSRSYRYPISTPPARPRDQAHAGPAYQPRMPSTKPPDVSDLFKNSSSKTWEWDFFRRVLIQLAGKGAGKYTPAPKRPDYIHLDGLQDTVSELRQLSSKSEDREVSRVVFVDTERLSLVISGKTHIGSATEVKIDMQPEPGRERLQVPVLTIHVHPGSGKTQGLSDIDYISFLSDYRMLVMMICYQEGILFAMKTSATMVASPESIRPRIAEIHKDIARIWANFLLPDAILAFNKAVCLEFGMTLYRAPASSENVAHRIEVTNL